MSELRQLQAQFWALISSPDSVSRALPEVAQRFRDAQVAPLSRWIVAPDEEVATARLDVYAQMYFFRLAEILCNDFPKVASRMGKLAFHELVVDYLARHPSTDPSVRHIGDRFPGFIASHPAELRWPGSSALALLELVTMEVFDAADEAAISHEVLARIPPQDWPRLQFVPIAAARLLRLTHDVTPFVSGECTHMDLEEGARLGQETFVLVYREAGGEAVFHKTVEPTFGRMYERLAQGAPFGVVCAELVGEFETIGEATEYVASVLGELVADGLIAAVHGLTTSP